MHRISLSIASLVLGGMCALAQEVSPADQCVSLAARGDVAALQQVYDSLQTTLPDYAKVYCRFAFARAKGDNHEIATLADSLETQFAQSFDSRGLLALSEEKCDALRQLGQYATLYDYSEERLNKFRGEAMESELLTTLKTYNKIGKLLKDRSATEEEWEGTSFAVPISRDWPLLIPASIDDSEDAPFFIDTSSQYSVISRQDAEEWGLIMPGETVMLDTPNGLVKASPIIVKSLSIGLLTLHNVLIFIVGDDVAAPYNRCIGNDILRRMQKIEINDQQMIVMRQSHNVTTSTQPSRQTKNYPICFNSWGGIDLQKKATKGYVRYSLDTSIPVDADDKEYRIKGVSYLKGANSVVIDFTAMKVTPLGGREYTPRTVADYIAQEDFFELLRNEAALYFTASEEELVLAEMALDKALTPPDIHTLSPTVQSVIISPEEAAKLNKPAHQLLVTSQGLVYEKAEGKRLKTMVVTDKMAASHKIDITNLKIY